MTTPIPAGWKLVPIEPTPEMLEAARRAPLPAVMMDSRSATEDLQHKAAYAAMLAAAPEAPPITVALDPDPRGVSVGVWQGSRCIYNGAHAIPAGSGPERDWELTCEECDGDGFVYVGRRVGMCATDVQTFKEDCECCEGRGFVFAFQDIPGIAEYVKSCRPAPAQDDTVARTGNTADHQAGWFAGIDHGRAEARAGAQDDAKTVAWMDPETLDVISAERKASWLAQYGAGGAAKAASYTRGLGDVAAPAAGDAREVDPLQGAANWLVQAHSQPCPTVLSACLMIGYNRAQRLYEAAIAAQVPQQGEA